MGANILDVISDILGMGDLPKGLMPDAPDRVVALFEYAGAPPEHFFTETARSYSVQARARAETAAAAYASAVAVQDRLDRYVDDRLVIRQASSILDIGQDDKARHEYTVNFKIDFRE